MYAAGKIPGGFFKREGRATERAILTARMIDRPIRPLWPKGFRNEVQVHRTVLSRGHGHPARHPLHQRRLGGAADLAAAVPRAGRRRADRAASTASSSSTRRCRRTTRSSTLDLIVVGTKDGLTMIEAGAERGAGGEPARGVRAGARRRSASCARRRRSCAARPASRSGSTPSSPRSSRARTGTRSGSGSRPKACARPAQSSTSSSTELAGEISMDSTEEDIIRQLQVRASLQLLLEKQRLAAVEGPVREQFETDLRALTDAEQDSKELKSAKRHLLFERIVDSVELPFPVGPATVDGDAPLVKDAAHEELRQEGRRGDLQGPRPEEDRDRQAAPRRARARRRSGRSSARWPSARGRTAPASSSAARRRS